MSVRPTNLGGGSQQSNTVATALVEADFIEAYQDPLTHQWRAKVRLDGGRVISGIRFLYPGSRITAGQRPPLPAKGERGIVGYPSSRRQIKNAYWLGSIDAATYGPDVSHPDEDLRVHPSGRAEITDKGGNYIYRYANNDHLLMGDAGKDPLDPRLPEIRYRQHPREIVEQGISKGKEENYSRHFYFAPKGALYGAKMQHKKEETVRDGNFFLNNATSTMELSAQFDNFRMPKKVRFDLKGDVEKGLHFSAQCIDPKPPAESHLTLETNGKAALKGKAKQQGRIEIDPDSGKVTMDADTLIELLTKTLKVKAQSVEVKAQRAEVKAQTIRLQAPSVKAGPAGSRAVAMADVVDANFAMISAVLGLPFVPTRSATLYAD